MKVSTVLIIFLRSSMAEHSAVNRVVAGSSPAGGAKNSDVIIMLEFFVWIGIKTWKSPSIISALDCLFRDKSKYILKCSIPCIKRLTFHP